MTTVFIRRNAPNDSCHNLTALMPRCTKTSFIITPHYVCAHRNSDNLRNAAFIGYCFIGYSLVARGMADEPLVVVLHHLSSRCHIACVLSSSSPVESLTSIGLLELLAVYAALAAP